MRILSVTILVSLMLIAVAAGRPGEAAGVPSTGARAAVLMQAAPRPVDDHDGSRVGVQLVVAGIAIGLVVGVGTGAYLLRRKLGLTAYAPDQNAGGHH